MEDLIHVCCVLSFLVLKTVKANVPVVLTKWEDTLSSPNYPFTYPANSTLTWIKSVSTGNRITVIIHDFQTECDGDYLEFRDGDSIASPMLAKYCGNSGAGQSISSSGTHMLLRFVSDNVNVTVSSNSRGFYLGHSGVCKVQTNETSGVITTPKYPGDYLNYMECLWTIKLHASMLIALECHDIALEYKDDCMYDYMEILAGVSLDAPVIGRYCGVYNHSLAFERDGNMSIRFVSDKDKELSGFRCAYNVDKGSSSPLMVPLTQDTVISPVKNHCHTTRGYRQNTEAIQTFGLQTTALLRSAVTGSSLSATPLLLMSSVKNQNQRMEGYSTNFPETIHHIFDAKRSSSLNSPPNGLTTESFNVRGPSKHTFLLATKVTLHSNAPFSGDAPRSSDHIISLATDRRNTETIQTLGLQTSALLRSTVSSSSDEIFSLSKVTENSPRTFSPYAAYSLRTTMTYSMSVSDMGVSGSSESLQVNLVPSWRTKTVETKSDHGHTETVSSSHTTATWATTVCCETSTSFRQEAQGSSMHQAHRESTHSIELMRMTTVREKSYAKASRLFTISPSSTASSKPAVASIPPNLKPPWHLIPFTVILFLVLVVLVTYCLRIPHITEKITLTIKDRKKKIKRSRADKSFNLKEGGFFKSFEASTFHSYQRELFYDATLNYAMFEQSTTKAIEFSIHLDEEEQNPGPEESVEISCALEEEPAKKKQGRDSLSEMFDDGGSGAARSSAKKIAYVNNSSVCYNF